jgi:hypothetical protein
MVKPLETSSARYGIVYMAQNGLQSNVTIEIAIRPSGSRKTVQAWPAQPSAPLLLARDPGFADLDQRRTQGRHCQTLQEELFCFARVVIRPLLATGANHSPRAFCPFAKPSTNDRYLRAP